MQAVSPISSRFDRRPRIRRQRLAGRWRERLRLPDGRELILRPIEPADASALQHGFGLLTPEEIRMRFLHPMKAMPESMARRLANPDPKREFALVAAEPLPPGQALIGAVVRASIDASGEGAEFAILVARLLARQGLGRLLMQRLLHWARAKRLRRVYGDVLEENQAMLALARSLGFQLRHPPCEPGLIRVELELGPARAHS